MIHESVADLALRHQGVAYVTLGEVVGAWNSGVAEEREQVGRHPARAVANGRIQYADTTRIALFSNFEQVLWSAPPAWTISVTTTLAPCNIMNSLRYRS